MRKAQIISLFLIVFMVGAGVTASDVELGEGQDAQPASNAVLVDDVDMADANVGDHLMEDGTPQPIGNVVQCSWCAKTSAEVKLRDHDNISWPNDSRQLLSNSKQWCGACRLAYVKAESKGMAAAPQKARLKRGRPKKEELHQSGPAVSLKALGKKRARSEPSALDIGTGGVPSPAKDDLFLQSSITNRALFEQQTAADSSTNISLLTPARRSARLLNINDKRKELQKDNICVRAQLAVSNAENVTLRSRLRDLATVEKDAVFLHRVRAVNSKYHQSGFKKDTIQRLVNGLYSGQIAAGSVEAHHIGDLARNYSAKSRGGFRFSPVVKGYACYLLLLSRTCYRAIRGGEGCNLGMRASKPISSFNLLFPHENTLEREMAKWDPDSSWRLGESPVHIMWFFEHCCAMHTKANLLKRAGFHDSRPRVRLAFDGTHVTPGLEFVRDVIFNMPEYPGCVLGPDKLSPDEVRVLYASLIKPIRHLIQLPGSMKVKEQAMVRQHLQFIDNFFRNGKLADAHKCLDSGVVKLNTKLALLRGRQSAGAAGADGSDKDRVGRGGSKFNVGDEVHAVASKAKLSEEALDLLGEDGGSAGTLVRGLVARKPWPPRLTTVKWMLGGSELETTSVGALAL
eukprot:2104735-Rhodomonas_salina.1